MKQMGERDPLHAKDTWLVNKDQREYQTGGLLRKSS